MFGTDWHQFSNPIKPLIWLMLPGQLTASAFNHLDQYVLVTGSTATQNSLFIPPQWPTSMPVLIVPTHRGMARLSWACTVDGCILRWFACTKTVTHRSTNRAGCRVTLLIATNRRHWDKLPPADWPVAQYHVIKSCFRSLHWHWSIVWNSALCRVVAHSITMYHSESGVNEPCRTGNGDGFSIRQVNIRSMWFISRWLHPMGSDSNNTIKVKPEVQH